MSVAEAIDIGAQIALGLAAAHAAGIVHRDVKPENVIVRPDGLVKVLDFGLAKLAEKPTVSKVPQPARSVHTEPGMVLGTVQYMSPEQARGLPVDGRTDVWSLGAVIYEMLAGHPPFEGATSSDIIVAVLDREPKSLDALSPAIPQDLQQIVTRALRKDREGRYPSMQGLASGLKHLQRELERVVTRAMEESHSTPDAPTPRRPARSLPAWRVTLLTTLVVSILLATTVLMVRRRQVARDEDGETGSRAATLATPTRLAVLPFENLGAKEDAFVVDGMADEVRGKLASLPGLQVIARSSSGQYRGSSKSAQEIVRGLGVRYLLTATVRSEKGVNGGSKRLRVNPELVEVTSGGKPVTIWQQGFNATFSDAFQMQSDVAERVAQALGVALGASERSRIDDTPRRISRPTRRIG